MEIVKPLNGDEWVDADPQHGIPGSIPPVSAFKQTLEEMVHVITESGLTPDGNDTYQFIKAIRALVQARVDEANLLAVSNTVYQRNVGDFFFTLNTTRGTKLSGSLNGAYVCNGDEFSASDFEGEATPYILLTNNKLPWVSYEQYAQLVDQYGNCGYFGLDTENQKFKVPTITSAFLEAGTPGEFKEAGIPNVSGRGRVVQVGDGIETPKQGEGCVEFSTPYDSQILFKAGGGWYGTGNWDLKIDASKSSPVYGKSTTVQPAAVCGRIMVQLANEIDNATSIEKYLNELKTARNQAITAIESTGTETLADVASHLTELKNEAETSATAKITKILNDFKDETENIKTALDQEYRDIQTYIDTTAEPLYENLDAVVTKAEGILPSIEIANQNAETNLTALTELNSSAEEKVALVTEKVAQVEETARQVGTEAISAAKEEIINEGITALDNYLRSEDISPQIKSAVDDVATPYLEEEIIPNLETMAKNWATKMDEPVEGTEYSAKYYAMVCMQIMSEMAKKADTLAGYGIVDGLSYEEIQGEEEVTLTLTSPESLTFDVI